MENENQNELREERFLTLKEFCLICNLQEGDIIEMVEIGILTPTGEGIPSWQFSVMHVHRVRKAQRLLHDLKLNLQGVALGLELLDEMKRLQETVRNLEYQLKLLTQI